MQTVSIKLSVPDEAPTLSEILAPFREQVEASGMTEEEMDALFEAAREEGSQERLAQQNRLCEER